MVAESFRNFITPQEYLTFERGAESKSEYFNGEIFALAGASFNHNRLTTNAVICLGPQLRGGSCQPFSSDMRVRVTETGMYTYPDVVVACAPIELEDDHADTLLNPRVIIEVLSPSTEAYDRGEKFAHYRRLESLSDYVLVAQDRMRVEHFRRQESGDWLLHVAEIPSNSLDLKSIGCQLNLGELYADVLLPDKPETGRQPAEGSATVS